MSIFDYSDYKPFVRDWVAARPKGGRGAYRKIAEHLRISTTMVSQIFNGDKHLSDEHASSLCDFLGLSDRQADFFLLLVDLQKAGAAHLRRRLERRLREMQQEALRIANRVDKDRELDETQKAVYYSSWMFSGIRNLLALDLYHDVGAIAERLHLPSEQVAKVLEFLIDARLCVADQGRLVTGPRLTHLPASSPLVIKHHQNWRLQGFARMPFTSEDNLFYTGPMSLSREDAVELRKRIVTFIEEMAKLVAKSRSEEVRCINIDWFGY